MRSTKDASVPADPPARKRLLSHREPPRALRSFACALGVLWTAALVFAAIRTPELELHNVTAEDHPLLEIGQLVVWILIAPCVAIGSLRQRTMRGLLLLQWMGLVALLLTLRELDLQVIINTDNIHLLGIDPEHAMHWKTRWLFYYDHVPLGVKLAWTGVIGGLFLAVVIPFALARYPWPTRLLRLDRFPWTLAVGVGLLGCSFVVDSFLEESMVGAGLPHTLIEELIEVGGVGFVFAWTAWLAFGRPDLHIGSP